MTLSYILEQLKLNGYRATEPRRIILTVLLKQIHTVLSADELYLLVKEEDKKVNRSTVYRNIEILTELELLYKTITDQGITKVKLICTDEHHHHLICDICGKIVIFHNCNSSYYSEFAKSHGFTLTGHTLELHGLCDNCKNN